jgi:hypothetical protein
MEKWFNRIGVILLTIIVSYIIWISFGLYNSYIEIEEMYSETYENRMDIEYRVWKIVEIREEQIYLEKEAEKLNNK